MVFTRHGVSECEYQLDLCFVELITDMMRRIKGSSGWSMHFYVAIVLSLTRVKEEDLALGSGSVFALGARA